MGDNYRSNYTFGMDFGTSHLKYGPISCGELPRLMENRGYIPDTDSLMHRALNATKEIVVGEEVALHLQSYDELSSRLIYPMRNGLIERENDASWRIVREIAQRALVEFKPRTGNGFHGFNVVASLSSVCPRYMFEDMFRVFEEIDGHDTLINMATIIPQPLAVAIGHGITTCVVVESGHGNTQICPISKYPLRNAIVAINRGGGDANGITAEILRDLGYGDLVCEETVVRSVKESLGLVPPRLDESVEAAKKHPRKFAAKMKIAGTRIVIDFEDKAWMRFLIGEYAFNPNHELFQSYFSRGMKRPRDVRIGDTIFHGMMDLGEAIARAVETCPVELQPHLYGQVLLSGGNFNWQYPEKLSGWIVNATTKVRLLLKTHGISNVRVRIAKAPQFSVWHGCIIYGYAIPEDYRWTWERMEGWMPIGA